MPNSKTACLPAGRELSIIIVNYRSGQYLKNCIASLFNNLKNTNCEIIVVNNDAGESLEQVAAQFPEVKIINNQRNFGFGAANNQGAKNAQGEILWFLNPDTQILSKDVDKILKKFAENNKVSVIGPRLLTEERKTQPWCAGKEAGLWRNIKNKFGAIESREIWESKNTILADWVSGAAMFVKKEAFDLAGGFDENFFMYFEDLDLCRRIRGKGWQVLFCPEASVLHLGGKSRKNRLKQKMQYYKSFLYYIKKRKSENV